MALALLTLRYTKAQALMVAAATILVEPLGGVLGISAVTLDVLLLPWGPAFAAGAMTFVISDEIIPRPTARAWKRMARSD